MPLPVCCSSRALSALHSATISCISASIRAVVSSSGRFAAYSLRSTSDSASCSFRRLSSFSRERFSFHS